MLIACLNSPDFEKLRLDAARAFTLGARAVEIRADFLSDPGPVAARAAVTGPGIYTLRPEREGGLFRGSEAKRLTLLYEAIEAGFDFVDAEHDADFSPPPGRAKIIRSMHCFDKVPGDLDARLRKILETRPFFAKAACRCDSLQDEIRLIGAQRAFGAKAAVFGFGGRALASRVLGLKFGAPAVYSALSAGRETAEGQPLLTGLAGVFRAPEIGPGTAVFGIAGHPIAHSRSPAFHNAAFAAAGADAVYLAFDCEDFGELWAGRETLALSGLSVTIPHKEAALAVADEKSDAAVKAGCANTLTMIGGTWRADNTDVAAILAALFTAGFDPAGGKALVLGAGGAARAALAALTGSGCGVTVAARNPEKGAALARSFAAGFVDLVEADPSDFDLVFNATPVGMEPLVDATPIDPSLLAPGQLVFDAIYAPPETALLRAARARGCAVLGGASMFEAQAALQQEIWNS